MDITMAFVTLGIINSIVADVELAITGFKIIVLLFIIQFIRGHFDAGPVPVLLTIIMGYIFLFHYWYVFGPIMLLYFLIIFGFTSILLDIAIVRPWAGGHGGGEPDTAAGKDHLQRMGKYKQMGRFR